MSFFFESDDEKRIRVDRERSVKNERREQARRQKDLLRQKKRKENDLALQKEINDEVERLVDENSSEKKKARLESMTGSSLMKSAFGLNTGPVGSASLNKGLRSVDTRGSLMSQSRPVLNDDRLNEDIQSSVKIPKLSRPF